MTGLDMSQGVPNVVSFIQSAIFSSPDYDSGVSEAAQNAIAAEFGITPKRPTRPRNATEMQSSLRDGRGTKPIAETQTVEEPPGSGNFVEKEVVVGEEPIPFTEKDRLVLSENPRVTIYPLAEGSERHRVEADTTSGADTYFDIDVPEGGAFPAAAINNRVNEKMLRSVFDNNGQSGVLQYLYGRGDATVGLSAETDFNSVGQDDMTQNIIAVFQGGNTTLGSRFLTNTELQGMADDTCWITPGGDFGIANQVDPATSTALMKAMFGNSQAEINGNMQRAGQFINTGGAETPSFEALYAAMYPDDAANGYTRLRELAGEHGAAVLNLPDVS